MKINNYRDFKKGMGVIVTVPDDIHDSKQNYRPGIVINSNPEYVRVQLLSSRPSEYDFGSFKINDKIQYLRLIYLKNIPLSQIKSIWKDLSRNSLIQLNANGRIMKLIEDNYHKVSSITLSLHEYLELKKENNELKKEIEELKTKQDEIIKLPNELETEEEYEL